MWARVTTAASSGSCVGCGNQVARAVPCACVEAWQCSLRPLSAHALGVTLCCVCVRGLPPLECCEGDVHDLNAPAVYLDYNPYHLISAAMADAKPKERRFRFWI